MNRRDFLSWAGVGGLATFLPIAIAACSPSGSNDTADATDEPQSIDVGSLSDLDSKGSLLIESPQKVIVVRDPADATAVLALTANCNHRDCTVEWQADSSEFLCPCHQSRFALDGSIQEGPATEALRPLTVTVENDQIKVMA